MIYTENDLMNISAFKNLKKFLIQKGFLIKEFKSFYMFASRSNAAVLIDPIYMSIQFVANVKLNPFDFTTKEILICDDENGIVDTFEKLRSNESLLKRMHELHLIIFEDAKEYQDLGFFN